MPSHPGQVDSPPTFDQLRGNSEILPTRCAERRLKRSGQSAYDLIFLDAERREYPSWWPHLRRVLSPQGLLIVDNATSHIDEMAPFIALVTADAVFATCLVPVGKGEFLAVKAAS